MCTEPKWEDKSGIRVDYSPELLAKDLRAIRGEVVPPGHPSQLEPIQAQGDQVQAGALDGITILRYAHIFRARSSGGVEQYLRQLDRHLLQRHRMNIVQMHLVDADCNRVEVENVGIGRIYWLQVPLRRGQPGLSDLPQRLCWYYKTLLTHSRQSVWAGRRAVGNFMRVGRLRHRWVVLSDGVADLLRTQSVDLLSLHWSACDTSTVIRTALRVGVPFVFVNHFDNNRLFLRTTRKHIAPAARIGTVSGCGIPDDLRDRCSNLADAIDTDYFDPEKVVPADPLGGHVLFLPGRIGDGKGHRDLLEAGKILIAKNINVAICFAGAVESNSLYGELHEANVEGALRNRIFLLGELKPEEIRSWYARSSVVALPTSSEGLPRVLLEAQAMKIPVVAYSCGGTPEALIPNASGFLVEKGNIAALADSIELLLENQSTRVKMGESGREYVMSHFGIPALIRRHEVFYMSALGATTFRIAPPAFGTSSRGRA